MHMRKEVCLRDLDVGVGELRVQIEVEGSSTRVVVCMAQEQRHHRGRLQAQACPTAFAIPYSEDYLKEFQACWEDPCSHLTADPGGHACDEPAAAACHITDDLSEGLMRLVTGETLIWALFCDASQALDPLSRGWYTVSRLCCHPGEPFGGAEGDICAHPPGQTRPGPEQGLCQPWLPCPQDWGPLGCATGVACHWPS